MAGSTFGTLFRVTTADDGRGFVLHCVGGDEVDDGGGRGDLFFRLGLTEEKRGLRPIPFRLRWQPMNMKQNIAGIVLGVGGVAIQVGVVLSDAWPGEGTEFDDKAAMLFLLAIAGFLVGLALLVGGIALYARARERTVWWGLLGIFGVVGAVLAFKLIGSATRRAKKKEAKADPRIAA